MFSVFKRQHYKLSCDLSKTYNNHYVIFSLTINQRVSSTCSRSYRIEDSCFHSLLRNESFVYIYIYVSTNTQSFNRRRRPLCATIFAKSSVKRQNTTMCYLFLIYRRLYATISLKTSRCAVVSDSSVCGTSRDLILWKYL